MSTEETTTVEQQTGYPDGEVQQMFVMYEDVVYVYDGAYKRHIDESEVLSKFEEGVNLYAKSGHDSEVYVYSVDTLYRMIPYKD